MKKCVFHIGFLVILMLCSSCVSRGVREAQAVVSQADSLRHEGQMFRDSAALAESYTTLTKWQCFYPDDYARCCYHYGRLLREKDNPVAAMEVFINATHSHTDDLHILGRVYSNMGDICHLAGDYSLSSNMYDYCAQKYLANGDTLLFYYGLYRTAFEKALKVDTIGCYAILNTIKNANIHDDSLHALCDLTRAQVLYKTKHYDTATQYAHKVLKTIPNECTATLILAQAYSCSGMRDSAVHYAQLVIEYSDDLPNQNNALYILTNDDKTKDKDAVLETAAKRADVQKLLEIRRGKMTQAAQLLEQDINKKPNLAWLFAIIGTSLVIGCCIYVYIYRQRRQKNLLTQEIEHLETQYHNLQSNKLKQLEHTCATLHESKNIKKDLFWSDFNKMCHFVNEHMFLLAGKLCKKQILNETEIRLCVLVIIGLSRTEISHILPYALNSVGKLKDHTAKLLGTTGKNLRNFLLKMAIE